MELIFQIFKITDYLPTKFELNSWIFSVFHRSCKMCLVSCLVPVPLTDGCYIILFLQSTVFVRKHMELIFQIFKITDYLNTKFELDSSIFIVFHNSWKMCLVSCLVPVSVPDGRYNFFSEKYSFCKTAHVIDFPDF